MKKTIVISSFLLMSSIVAHGQGLADHQSVGSDTASLRDVDFVAPPMAVLNQIINGLGELSFKDGILIISYNKAIKLPKDPEFSHYTIPNGATIFDINFAGTPATEGGTVNVADPFIEKVAVGQNKKGELQIRLYGRLEAGDIGARLQFKADSGGLSLSPATGVLVAAAGGDVIPPMHAPSSKPLNSLSQEPSVFEAAPKESAIDTLTAAATEVQSDGPKFEEAAGFESNLYQAISITAAALSAIALGGFLLVRARKSGGFGFGKQDQMMEVVSRLSIGPKRQILLVKIRGQEIAIASTEAGIQFLSEIGFPMRNEISLPSAHSRLSMADASSAAKRLRQEESEPVENKRGDLLVQAFKQLKDKKLGNVKSKEDAVPEPTIKQASTSGSKFPKYLANAFDQEAKRDLPSQSGDESAESVTNLIREKLKGMKTL